MTTEVVNNIYLSVSQQFSTCPGPRYVTEGDHSGELFRKKLLEPMVKQAIENKQKLIIDLDGTAGYGTSFLEESFGGLIRSNFLYENIMKHLHIKSDEEEYLIEDIYAYLKDAHNETNK